MEANLLTEQPALDGRHHIQSFLDKGEGQSIEFKQRLNEPEKIAKTICSMANTTGGNLLIGVKDDKSIIGIDPEQEKFIIGDAVQHFTQPPIAVTVTEVFVKEDEYPYHEKSVLLITIPESEEKPHKAKNNEEWQVYLRHQDQSLMAGSKAEMQLENDSTIKPKKVKLSKNQQRLLAYLQKYPRITQKEYASLVNISDRRARRELMENLNLGLIRVLEHEKEDYFVL